MDNEVVAKTQCELVVVMLSDKLIAESVTLVLHNIDTELFLDRLYERFVDSVLNMLPASRSLKRVIYLKI
jgi:hypothetical protein